MYEQNVNKVYDRRLGPKQDFENMYAEIVKHILPFRIFNFPFLQLMGISATQA